MMSTDDDGNATMMSTIYIAFLIHLIKLAMYKKWPPIQWIDFRRKYKYSDAIIPSKIPFEEFERVKFYDGVGRYSMASEKRKRGKGEWNLIPRAHNRRHWSRWGTEIYED